MYGVDVGVFLFGCMVFVDCECVNVFDIVVFGKYVCYYVEFVV